MKKKETRIEIRNKILEAIAKERIDQESMFPAEYDDQTVQVDLNHMVSVIIKYLGNIANQAVNQVDVEQVNYFEITENAIKCSAVFVAMIEAIISTGNSKL